LAVPHVSRIRLALSGRRLLAVALALCAMSCAESWEELNERAKQAHRAGRTEEAEELFGQALAEARKLGPDDSRLVMSLNNLGELHRSAGRLDQAVVLYREALAIRERLVPDDDLELAVSYGNLAQHHQNLGQPEEALDLYRREAEVRERALGESDPSVAGALSNAGVAALLLGRHDEARTDLERAIAILEGGGSLANPPELALALTNLAQVEDAAGALDRSEQLYRRALQVWIMNRGESSIEAIRGRRNLADHLARRALYDEAEELYAAAARTLEVEHPRATDELGSTWNNLGMVYAAMGRVDDAERSYRKAVTALEAESSPALAATLFNLGRLLARSERSGEACEPLSRSLELRQRALGPGHPDLEPLVRAYAAALRESGRGGDAERVEAEWAAGASGDADGG
jgi:tetratricopeptide (TPR) repeat protein